MNELLKIAQLIITYLHKREPMQANDFNPSLALSIANAIIVASLFFMCGMNLCNNHTLGNIYDKYVFS